MIKMRDGLSFAAMRDSISTDLTIVLLKVGLNTNIHDRATDFKELAFLGQDGLEAVEESKRQGVIRESDPFQYWLTEAGQEPYDTVIKTVRQLR